MDMFLNPISWYSERELEFTPLHFTVAKTPLTNESKLWILNNLEGRFSVIYRQDITYHSTLVVDALDGVPAFEDPKEAMIYELKWS